MNTEITKWFDTPSLTREKMDRIHQHLLEKLRVMAEKGDELGIYITVVLEGTPNPQSMTGWVVEDFEGEKLVYAMIPPTEDQHRYEYVIRFGREFPYNGAKGVLLASSAWIRRDGESNREEVLMVCDSIRGLMRESKLTIVKGRKPETLENSESPLLLQFWIGVGGNLAGRGILKTPFGPPP